MTYLAHVQPSHQIIPLDIVSPGGRGLNTVQAGQLMDQSYATEAFNAVIDAAGRLASRLGAATVTTTPVDPTTVTNETIATGDGTTVSFNGDFANINLVRSSITITAGAVTATDNGAGILSGTGVSGSINYNTGEFNLLYAVAPGNAVAIQATYEFTPIIRQIFEYNAGNQQYTKVVAWDGGISTNLIDPNLNSIAGTAPVTSGQWFFQNFNNKMIGFIAGQKPAVYTTGSGVLNTIVESQGVWPLSSGVGCCAFGRVWSVSQSDGQTMTYSGLLDETDVGSASAGQINMASVWSAGTDTITAIFAWNATLVVAGLKHIVMFTDGRGSLIGMDPTQAYVFDELIGTGVLSQWSVAAIGEADIVYLSQNGVQSLGRMTAERSNPTIDLTKFVRNTFLAQIANEALGGQQLQGTYNPIQGFYLINCPNSGTVWCLDQRRRYTDDTGNLCAIITTWQMTATAFLTDSANNTYIGRTAGEVTFYSGNVDQDNAYQFSYISPWMSFQQQGGPYVSTKLKMLKRFRAFVFTAGNDSNINVTWNTDFNPSPLATTINLSSTFIADSTYGVGEYGLAAYGGGGGLVTVSYDARARGQYYQFGIQMNVSSFFALQQLQATLKLGRVA